MTTRPHISPEDACLRAGVSKTRLRRWCRNQDRFAEPIAFRVAGRWRIYEDAIARMAEGSLDYVRPAGEVR
jgi:predicted site-specific integrase-resolvase